MYIVYVFKVGRIFCPITLLRSLSDRKKNFLIKTLERLLNLKIRPVETALHEVVCNSAGPMFFPSTTMFIKIKPAREDQNSSAPLCVFR